MNIMVWGSIRLLASPQFAIGTHHIYHWYAHKQTHLHTHVQTDIHVDVQAHSLTDTYFVNVLSLVELPWE